MAGYLYSDLPGRLDRLGWNRFHTTVLLTLGAGWALDGFEVTVVGPMLAYLSRVFHLNVVQGAWVGSIFLLGALGGALIFSTLADRLGRKRLFLATILLYGLSTFATAFAGLYAVYGTAGVFAGMAALAGVGLAGMTLWSLYGVQGKAHSLEQMTTRPLPAGAAAEVEA
ncbi:MAG: MFS transporter [Thermaerobacter sp.]|nr:MFS transporter [Thermaerobacter sp.]